MSKQNASSLENYVPFEDEWKAEMKKLRKDILINIFADKFSNANKLRDAVQTYIDAPSFDSMEAMKVALSKMK